MVGCQETEEDGASAPSSSRLKRCGKCKKFRSVCNFKQWNAKGKRKLQSYCRDCSREYDKYYRNTFPEKIQAYREKHREREKARDKARARPRTLAQYGLTIEDFDRMAAEQDGKCLICDRVPTDTLVVDHCHETGVVGGLLCRKCNASLGGFGDDPKIVERALRYLLNNRPSTG